MPRVGLIERVTVEQRLEADEEVGQRHIQRDIRQKAKTMERTKT